MVADATLEDAGTDHEPDVSLLFEVLSYDDLLTAPDRAFVLDEMGPELSIGRAEPGEAAGRGEIRIADRWASGRHARIAARGGAWIVKDEGSRNCTYVDGRRIREHRLTDGALVEVGHTLFCYRTVPKALAAAAAEGADFGPTRTRSHELVAVAHQLLRLAPSREPVLILGETGSGKELAAAMLHRLGGLKGEFVAVDCGAIPPSLFESTLFGHVRGAFTGAEDTRKGAIARANGGTLFLDEVGNLDSATQPKLLRVLESSCLTPVGGDPIPIDVRWVAATNEDVLADSGTFRQDLARRLAGWVARLPPLRRRREDLGALAAHLLREAGASRSSMTAAAGRLLFSSPFVGNVRELRAVLRTASLLAGEGSIDVPHLPRDGETDRKESPAEQVASRRSPPSADELRVALEQAHGNVVHAAKTLSTHPRQLYRWLERHAIDPESFR